MFTLIATVDLDFGIARGGDAPWYIPNDRVHFRKTTEGHVVIMDKATYMSIPRKFRPLSNRLNVVIAKEPWGEEGILVMTFEQCMEFFAANVREYASMTKFVAGGRVLYKKFLQSGLVSRMVISHVFRTWTCDKFFPALKDGEWALNGEKQICSDPVVKVHTYDAVNGEERGFMSIIRAALDGVARPDRTGVGNMSVFSREIKFSLAGGRFPLMTHRKLPLRLIFEELMWVLRGQTDAKILAARNVHVWEANTSREFLDKRGLVYQAGPHAGEKYAVGDIGPTYGFQLRHFGAEYRGCDQDYTGEGFDQLTYIVNLIKTDPNSRRIMFSMWNPADLDKMALPPCAWSAQFYVADGKISCKMTQRSSDISLAGGWNIAQYALLTHMMAVVCDLEPGHLIWSPGDIHVYATQVGGVEEILKRRPRSFPVISVKKVEDITRFEWDDVVLVGYNPHPSVKLPMAV